MLRDKKIISIIILLILFCMISLFVNIKESLVIDEKIYNMVSLLHSEIMTHFFKAITYLGNAKFIACFLIILLIITKIRDKVGIPIVITTIVSGVLNIVLKNIFLRQRPSFEQLVFEDSFSFPSGHSMATATIYSMIIYLSCKYIKNKKMKYFVNVISVLVILFIGVSRIYLRVHYFSDVIAGWILGIVIVLIYSIFEDSLKIQNKK